MAAAAELPSTDEMQDDLIIQRKLAEALHPSLAAVTCQPLPSQIALLLLHLAFAETVDPGSAEAWKAHFGVLMDAPETEIVTPLKSLASAGQIVARQYTQTLASFTPR